MLVVALTKIVREKEKKKRCSTPKVKCQVVVVCKNQSEALIFFDLRHIHFKDDEEVCCRFCTRKLHLS